MQPGTLYVQLHFAPGRVRPPPRTFFFFFNDTATTEIYTLSLHDALPISTGKWAKAKGPDKPAAVRKLSYHVDRKSTRLNSSHLVISYAVFCLKKKNNNQPVRTLSPTATRIEALTREIAGVPRHLPPVTLH